MQPTIASELLLQFTSLTTSFSQLGVRLSQAASALQDLGLPPSASLLADLTVARRDFTDLCANVLALAEGLAVTPLPLPAELASLIDLRPLLQRVVEAEQQRAAVESLHQQALLALDRVVAITRRDGSDFPPLRECRERAQELHSAITEASWPQVHPGAEALATGKHPFAQLLMLVEGQEELDDDQWALLQDVVEQTFGKSLSIAASRGRLVISPEYSSAALAKPRPAIVISPERLSVPLVASLSAAENPETDAGGEASVLVPQPQAAYTAGVELSLVAEDTPPFLEETVRQNGATLSLPEETETPNGTATPTSFLSESAREDTTVTVQEEKQEKQEDAAVHPVLYHFGPETAAQEIVAAVLHQQAAERPAILRDLMWRLIHEEKVILAFHMARSLESLYPELQPCLPSWLMRSVVLGRHVRHANGEIARLLEEDFGKCNLECFTTSYEEWNTAVRFLVAAAALQPALLAPDTGASPLLHSLPDEAGLPQFSAYRRLLADYGGRRQPLDPRTFKKGRGQAAWQADLDTLKQTVESWCARAARTTLVFSPATKVWRRWQEPKGLIHSLLLPVRQNDASKLQAAKRVVEQLLDEAQFKREVDYTDRKVLGRLLGEDIPARALEPIRAQVREAVGFTRRWIELQESRPDQSQSKGAPQEQVEQLRQQVESCQEAVLEELNSLRRREPSVLIGSAVSCCRRVVENIQTLCDPQAFFPTEEPLPKPFLYTDLLRIPSLPINEQWELVVPNHRPVVDGILELVAKP
ncbi:MAG TPA: hypothetical protein VKK81_22640 [Candidatus Binatia bacterium]|nr:hypothetical protein [Candidatus Binatia bacterium]